MTSASPVFQLKGTNDSYKELMMLKYFVFSGPGSTINKEKKTHYVMSDIDISIIQMTFRTYHSISDTSCNSTNYIKDLILVYRVGRNIVNELSTIYKAKMAKKCHITKL